MTRFNAFAALRYQGSTDVPADISHLVAPPYDVLSDEQRNDLEAKHPANSVRLDFPHGKTDPNAYVSARAALNSWRDTGTLTLDGEPSLTVYRMTDPSSGRVTTGVIGALGLEHPGVGSVLPHEETTAKDKADRLSLIRATEINTSPIWVLATTSGLGALCTEVANGSSPAATAVDLDGVRHEVWIVTDSAKIAQLRAFVEDGPVVVADGHHRLETALAYETERPEADAIMAYVVELSPDELEVRPIHRIVSAPSLDEVLSAIDSSFDRRLADSESVSSLAGPVLVLPDGSRSILVPRPGSFDDAIGLDSERVRIALSSVRGAETAFHHDIATVVARAKASESGAVIGLLLRPATVPQIRAVADARTRMPPKTTFFFPKPRTGLLFRPVVDQL